MSAVLAAQLPVNAQSHPYQLELPLRDLTAPQYSKSNYQTATDVVPFHPIGWQVPPVIRKSPHQEEFQFTAAMWLDQIFKNLGKSDWHSHLAELKEVPSLIEELVSSTKAKPYELESPIVERLIAVLINNPHFVIRQAAASTLTSLLVDLDERLPVDEIHSNLLQNLKERIRKLTRLHVYGLSEQI